jgi:cobalt-zinc-cadmium efflux system protein
VHAHASNGVARPGRGAGNDAANGRLRNRKLLLAAVLVTGIVLAIEVVGGVVANSLALLSDAGHVLTDLLALVFSYTAIVISSRPANSKKSFGYYRVEILAALLNGALLLVISGAILRESFLRFRTPEPILPGPMILTAAVGLAGNLVAMMVLSPGRSNLNVRAAFLHVLGDTLSSVGVLAAGFGVMATGWIWLDSVAGGLIAVVIVLGAVRLLKESTDILLEACPVGIDGGEVEARILTLPEIASVHDLHIWSITSGMPALSGHVVLRGGVEISGDDLLGRLQRLLRDEFQIDHSTFQIESETFEEIGEIH